MRLCIWNNNSWLKLISNIQYIPISNLNKNIVFIKFGDDKKINRKTKRKIKPKARQQKPMIISAGGRFLMYHLKYIIYIIIKDQMIILKNH